MEIQLIGCLLDWSSIPSGLHISAAR